ncbi:hypothetical protein BDV96DRAFT_574117 [Lophiotrema nucula]|uniref:RING-type domain-containing protein n=1 Tax=Lophiotrema nucula TaxID=690887 RepID=A0A6A5ZBL3_9PLEO|nr:hypothetical protein BDV96DRAFT_574117 [Lophiotrema nucula]
MSPALLDPYNIGADPRTHRWIRLLQVVLAMEVSVNPMTLASPEWYFLNAFDELRWAMDQWLGFQTQNNRWRKARVDETVVVMAPEPRWLDTQAREFIYDCLDDGVSVEDTVRELFVWFINQRAKECPCSHCRKVSEAWNARTEEQQRVFLDMMDISEQHMNRKVEAVDVWKPEDPSARQTDAYFKTLEQLSYPQRHGNLGMTIDRFIRIAFETRDELKNLGILEQYEDDPGEIEDWYRTILSPRQLVDKDCPICLEPFQFPVASGQQPKHLALRAHCGHIVCQACFIEWAKGDSPNADRCVLCRKRFWPVPAEAENWETMAEIMLDAHRYPEASASQIVEALQPYLSSLREALHHRCPFKANDDNLATLVNKLLGPTQGVVDWHARPVSHDLVCYAQASVDYIAASGERLKTFLNGDVDGYRRAVKKEFQVFVERAIYRFSFEMTDWQQYLTTEDKVPKNWVSNGKNDADVNNEMLSGNMSEHMTSVITHYSTDPESDDVYDDGDEMSGVEMTG